MLFLVLPILATVHGGVTPSPTYDAFFAFSGRFTKKQIVVSDCESGYGYDPELHRDWCERAEAMIKVRRRRAKFCVRTGRRTLAKCQDILKQNMRSYKLKGVVMHLPYRERKPEPQLEKRKFFNGLWWHDSLIGPEF